MSQQTRLQDLTTRVATELKSHLTLINGNAGDLSALTTTAKANLVAALNELKADVDAAAQSGGASISDASTSTSSVWSSQKVSDTITSAVSALIDGAPEAVNTLNELAAALGDDANFASTVTTALSHRVRVDAVQAFTEPEKAQGRDNLGAVSAAAIGNPDVDLVATFEAGLL